MRDATHLHPPYVQASISLTGTTATKRPRALAQLLSDARRCRHDPLLPCSICVASCVLMKKKDIESAECLFSGLENF